MFFRKKEPEKAPVVFPHQVFYRKECTYYSYSFTYSTKYVDWIEASTSNRCIETDKERLFEVAVEGKVVWKSEKDLQWPKVCTRDKTCKK